MDEAGSEAPQTMPMQQQPMQPQHMMQPQPIMQQPMIAQPSQQSTVVVVNQQKAEPEHPTGLGYPQGLRGWSSGLCGCFEDIPSCCLGYFCPCVLEIMTATKLNESCLLPWCVHGGTLSMRVKTRMLYGIQGDIMTDCLMLTCCPACAMCQNYRELKTMGR